MKLRKVAAAILAAAMMLSVPATVSALSWADEDIPLEDAEEVEEDWGWGGSTAKSFSTSLKPEFTATAGAEGIIIDWDYIRNADSYRIYRYNEKTKKYAKIGEARWFDENFYDTDIKTGTTYSYKIRAYDEKGNASQLSDAKKATVNLTIRPLTVGVTSSKIKLSWAKNKNADGYEIWYYKNKISSADKGYSSYTAIINPKKLEDSYTYTYLDNCDQIDYKNATYKKLKTTSSTSYSMKRDKNYSYYFKLRAYYVKNGKKVYSAFTDIKLSGTAEALMNGAKGSAKTSVSVVSYRSDVANTTLTYSSADKKIMDDFAKKHFTSKMSAFDKAAYLSIYIHNNVKYAESSSELSKISNVSPTKAIFEYKLGQCYQYNAAFTLFLAYLGFDVRLIASHRLSASSGNQISHYWGEITLDGKKFILDAGNKKDGLYYFAVPYENEPGNYMRTKH